MTRQTLVDHPVTASAEFEAQLRASLQQAPHLAVSLPFHNRPWGLLGQRALQEPGLTLIVAPHAASFADATSVLEGLGQTQGLQWMQLAGDVPPADSYRLRERLASGLVHLALIDQAGLLAGHPNRALETVPIRHLALWQPQRLSLPALARWLEQARLEETPSVSLWMPAIPLEDYCQVARQVSQQLNIPLPEWAVLPPAFSQGEVTVYRKLTERLKRNKLLRILQRETGARQPVTAIVVRTSRCAQALSHWLEEQLKRPVSCLTPQLPYRQQVSLLNQLRYSSGQMVVMTADMVDAVTLGGVDRLLRWIVWEPLSIAQLMAMAWMASSTTQHTVSECLVFHTRDDVVQRRERLKKRQADQPGQSDVALAQLKQWHDWILSNACRKISLMQRYRRTGETTLPVWLPQWDQHPPAPCGECDRCHQPSRSLVSKLTPWIQRLIY